MVKAVQYDGGGLRIGEYSMTFAGLNNLRYDLTIHSDVASRVILSAAGQAFPMGARTNPVDPSGRPEIDFVPEPGDRVELTVRHSMIGWPTPFDFSIMKQHTPWWKRYFYYRLTCTKSSGSVMEMLWRYEQDYVKPHGWTTPAMLFDYRTGLLAVNITNKTSAAETAVTEYIERIKKWKRSEYRVEARGKNADGRADVMAVIHVDDQDASHPGAGKSVELYLDPDTHQVLREVAGQ